MQRTKAQRLRKTPAHNPHTMPTHCLRNDVLKALARTLATLLLLPALTLWFTTYGLAQMQAQSQRHLALHLARNPDMPAASQQSLRDWHARHPLATLCRNGSAQAAPARQRQCARFSALWQFTWMQAASVATLAAGLLFLLWLAALGRLAFARHRWQYASFACGWRTLTAACVATIAIQGVMAVWLSYWATTLFWGKFSPQLIALVGIVVATAAAVVIACLFLRSPEGSSVEGEAVPEADAPLLWQRIRDMAARLKTPAPDHLVAGIDANFFVTQAPLTVNHPAQGAQTLRGRTLYVSIALLRQLSRAEADAVLAHELGHLSGGDTHSSARLGPKLAQFDRYMAHLAGTTALTRFVAHSFLLLYRLIFELALARGSRAREFRADRIAARLVSPRAVSHALIKIAAWASYRSEVESGLFSRDEQLNGQLGIGQQVARGLPAWSRSPAFAHAMAGGQIPHPFDSHPPMSERMAAVGHVEEAQNFADIVARPAMETWADDIHSAAQIEARLWEAYEKDFSSGHEYELACRYAPASAQELALVRKYFPDRSIVLKGGLAGGRKGDKALGITWEGITWPQGQMLARWQDIKSMHMDSSLFGLAMLVITLNEKKRLRHKRHKIKLHGIKSAGREPLSAMLGHYWERHQTARLWQALGKVQGLAFSRHGPAPHRRIPPHPSQSPPR